MYLVLSDQSVGCHIPICILRPCGERPCIAIAHMCMMLCGIVTYTIVNIPVTSITPLSQVNCKVPLGNSLAHSRTNVDFKQKDCIIHWQ